MTIVYLYDAKANVETRFMTLPDVYRDDYHPAEFVEGTLYVIRRTTGSDNPANTNWTDELWEYDQSAAGSKVYSAKGLDFRVSPDGKEIAVLHGDTAGSFALIDSVGNVLKILAGKDLRGFGQGKMLNPLFWHGGVLWLTANQGPQITDIYAFDTAVMVLSAYPIADFGVILNESAVEPASRTLAFGDYNPDVEHAAPRMSTLSVYDLATKKKVVIVAATVSRPFAPKWVDGSTVEYNDPHGSGRTTFSTFGIFKK